MRAINLLPREEQTSRFPGSRTPLLVAAGGVVAVTAASVLLVMSASGTIDEREAELASIEASLARLPRPPKTVVSQGALQQERHNRVAALSAALSGRAQFDRLFRELALVLPEDAWLTGLTAAAPSGAVPVAAPGSAPPPPSATGSAGVTITGATYTHDAVARVLSRLAVVPSLENVQLTASALVVPQEETAASGTQPAPSTGNRTPFVTFTVTASLRTEGAS